MFSLAYAQPRRRSWRVGVPNAPQSVKRHVEICLALSERDICVNPPPEGPTGLAVEEVVNRSEKREPSTNDASQQPDHLLRYQPMRLVPLSRCAYMGKMRSRSQLYICTRTKTKCVCQIILARGKNCIGDSNKPTGFCLHILFFVPVRIQIPILSDTFFNGSSMYKCTVRGTVGLHSLRVY